MQPFGTASGESLGILYSLLGLYEDRLGSAAATGGESPGILYSLLGLFGDHLGSVAATWDYFLENLLGFCIASSEYLEIVWDQLQPFGTICGQSTRILYSLFGLFGDRLGSVVDAWDYFWRISRDSV